jgi:ribonuclease HI
VIKDRVPRQIGEILINKSYPYGSFDGDNQRPNNLCSARGNFFFSNVKYFTFKASLGSRTNNSFELLALICLLKFTNKNNIERLQVF